MGNSVDDVPLKDLVIFILLVAMQEAVENDRYFFREGSRRQVDV